MDTDDRSLLIRTAGEIDDRWLGAVLGRDDVAVLDHGRIGTGQMSQTHRVHWRAGDGTGGSVVVKLAADDPQSRATGVGMGAYHREIRFYRDLAGRLGGSLAPSHLAVEDLEGGWFTLVLADITGAVVGDQIAGCRVEEAARALGEHARIVAPVMNDLAVGTLDVLNLVNPLNQDLLGALLPAFLDRYADRVTDAQAEVCRTFVAVADDWSADRRAPLGLVHGDYRLDNLLFTPGGCTAVDWQTYSWGPVMTDVSYFLGSGLLAADRRAHEEALVRGYHDELVGLGIGNFGWDDCWEEYRRQAFAGLVMTICASMVVERTVRGDDMFLTWFARVIDQIVDLDALSLLPEPGAKRAVLRPDPLDEGRHAPGPEPLWNESWYFDAVSDAEDLGVYVRLGRLPNQGVCLYTAAIVRPGGDAVMVVDAAAPLPPAGDDDQRITTASIDATQHCASPLELWRLQLSATGARHADHAAPLRDEAGPPVEVALDLTWRTDGVPYSWRQTTRYEIPCRVSGTVTVDGRTFALEGPGQRDHSWGSRDWWANDWMWSAFHLDDGTHTHVVTIPELPGLAVGYVQRDGEIDEISTGHSAAVATPDGLTASDRITTGPVELDVEVEPVGFGALRLVSPDGRIAHFPRAMARVRTADGRRGRGWIEWNRNQPS